MGPRIAAGADASNRPARSDTLTPMRARRVLAIAGLAAAAALLWTVARSAPREDAATVDVAPPVDGQGVEGRGAARSVAVGRVPDTEEPGRVPLESDLDADDLAPIGAAEREPEGPYRVKVQLVAEDSREPLPGYLVQLLPPGASPLLSPIRGASPTTDGQGQVTLPVEGPGTFDLHAWPLTGGRPEVDPFHESLAGKVRASRSRRMAWTVLALEVGPVVVYRGPLPPGVEASDLLLEARAQMSPISSQFGGYGGMAIARRTERGFAAARVPAVRNGLQGDAYVLRAVTRDGLWSTARLEHGQLTDATVAFIDGPLEPRGRVTLKLEFDPPGGEHLLEAFNTGLDWELPLGDGDEDSVLAASPTTRRVRRAGGNLFELQDLPIGPVEFRVYMSVIVEEERIHYRTPAPLRVDAAHGRSAPHVLTVRWHR